MSVPTLDTSLYAEVQQFYARQMQLLDAGAAEEVARTFTEDGWQVSPPVVTEPIVGRADLAAAAGKAAESLAAAGKVYRRCYSMINVQPRDDGTLLVTSYVQVIVTEKDSTEKDSTGKGGAAKLHAMCVCEDVLSRVDGELLVRERRIRRDDIG